MQIRIVDHVLEAFFLPPLTIDAFMSPYHKRKFDFTLDNPQNYKCNSNFVPFSAEIKL